MDVSAKREAAIARREQERDLKDKQRALAIKQRLQKERSKRANSKGSKDPQSANSGSYERTREELIYAQFGPLPTMTQLLSEMINLKECIAFIKAVDVEVAAKAYGLNKGPFHYTKMLNHDAFSRRLKLMSGNCSCCVLSRDGNSGGAISDSDRSQNDLVAECVGKLLHFAGLRDFQ
jgi:hypothetical protein